MQITKDKISKVNFITNASGIYLLNVNNESIRGICEICPKLTIKKSEGRQALCSGVFIVNFEQISHIYLVFSLLTLNRQMLDSNAYVMTQLYQCSQHKEQSTDLHSKYNII